jgi:hypothetical protein
VTPNRPAVRALVLAVVSLAVPVVPAILALVLAVWAARSTRDAPEETPGGRGLVPAAVALSVVGLVVWTGLAAAVILVPTRHEEPMAVAAPLEVPPTTAPPTTAVPTAATPTTAAPRPTTGNDQRWLKGIEKLHARLDKPFEAMFDLTPAKASSLATLFRGCGRELARLGTPSHRLHTVYGLVKQACAQYHKSARCFAAFASAPDQPKQDQAFDCAAAAHEEGSVLLIEAEAEGAAIMDLPADPDLPPP